VVKIKAVWILNLLNPSVLICFDLDKTTTTIAPWHINQSEDNWNSFWLWDQLTIHKHCQLWSINHVTWLGWWHGVSLGWRWSLSLLQPSILAPLMTSCAVGRRWSWRHRTQSWVTSVWTQMRAYWNCLRPSSLILALAALGSLTRGRFTERQLNLTLHTSWKYSHLTVKVTLGLTQICSIYDQVSELSHLSNQVTFAQLHLHGCP